MTGCFPIGTMNPINELLLSVFGDNFFPPMNVGFQPSDFSAQMQEPTLNMQLPANAEIGPIGDKTQTDLSGHVAGLIGQLGPIFSIFGVLFLILDLIRAIIDIICAMFNPEPMILALLDLFITVLPPIIALYPPLSTILMIINVIKLIVAIVVSLLAILIPLLDLVVENAQSIIGLIESGDLRAVDSVTSKLCGLFQQFANELGAFDPISFILQMIEFFSTLGSKFFCASDNGCCDTTSCPPLIVSPPSGTAVITAVVEGATLGSFIPLLPPDIAAFSLGDSTITIVDSNTRLGDLQNYVLDPSTLTGDDPATVRVSINGTEYPAKSASATANSITLKVNSVSGFSVGGEVSYTIVPDTTQLLTKNLISLGCVEDVRNAANGLANRFKAGALDPIVSRIGPFPSPNGLRQDLEGILAAQEADPTTDRTQLVKDVADLYLADLADYFADAVCLGADRVQTSFVVSTNHAFANGTGFSNIQLTPKDANGVALLVGAIPNAIDKFGAQFITTLGTVGPTSFDRATGTFQATITSTEVGVAEISAIFMVDGQECVRPGITDGFSVTDKINSVEFISEGGRYGKRRQQRQYVQSGGGRRR